MQAASFSGDREEFKNASDHSLHCSDSSSRPHPTPIAAPKPPFAPSFEDHAGRMISGVLEPFFVTHFKTPPTTPSGGGRNDVRKNLLGELGALAVPLWGIV